MSDDDLEPEPEPTDSEAARAYRRRLRLGQHEGTKEPPGIGKKPTPPRDRGAPNV